MSDSDIAGNGRDHPRDSLNTAVSDGFETNERDRHSDKETKGESIDSRVGIFYIVLLIHKSQTLDSS